MINPTITGHCVVKNEDRFVWFAINSVLPFLDRLIVFDTDSTDNTVQIIKSIKNKKIVFEEKGPVTPDGLTQLRNKQIEMTATDFFMLLDGDEIWPKTSMVLLTDTLPKLPKSKLAIYCRTRNAVGDVFHYLPENTGRYHFQNRLGNYNMRIFRNISGLKVMGNYPLESYTLNGVSLNNLDDHLFFLDAWYLHATHLARSSKPDSIQNTLHRQNKFRIEEGQIMKKNELPEVFFSYRPPFVPDPVVQQSRSYSLLARLLTPLKRIKRLMP